MSATVYVAAQAATGTTGSDGLAVFTFAADIDTTNHEILVDRLPQGLSIDYMVTATRTVTFIAPSIPVTGARIWLRNGVVGVSASTALPAWDTVAEMYSPPMSTTNPAETKPAPLTLASVLPWVRRCFALTTIGQVYPVVESAAIVGAQCRACKATVAPTADALASHECGEEAS